MGLLAVVAVLVLIVAVPPRLIDLDRFVTTDEIFWLGRAANFGQALEEGQYRQTFQSGHPGVTTMWTALLGMGREQVIALSGPRREISRREVSESPVFLSALADARRAFGVATAAGVLITVLLAWRLLGPAAAAIGGCLLALDPFLLAHSRLVHIDASLALWMTVAVLSGIVGLAGGGAPLMIVSGVATGLAVLSKAPALLLVLLVPAAGVWLHGLGWARRPRAWRALAVWALAAGLTYVAFWPAMWSSPLETIRLVVGFVRDNANPAHAPSRDADGAGLLFYPFVAAFRTTPLTWIGLVALAFCRPVGRTGRVAILLVAYAASFAAAMTFAAKNFDRYLLPVFPVLDLLAGLGFAMAIERHVGPSRRVLSAVVAAVAAVTIGAVSVAGSWPYAIAYANPLVGGPPAANRVIASGWGEGLDQVADYLNGRPNASRLRVSMPGEIYTTVLGSQLRGRVSPAEGADAGAYDYHVVYARNVQLGESAPFFDTRYLDWRPEAVAIVGGLPYAWVYATAGGAPVGAVFGDAAALEAYGLDAATLRAGRRLEVRLQWRLDRPLPDGASVLLALTPVGGGPAAVSARLAIAAGEPVVAVPSFRARYALSLPDTLQPGTYVLSVGLLDREGLPVPVTRQPHLGPAAESSPHWVALRAIEAR